MNPIKRTKAKETPEDPFFEGTEKKLEIVVKNLNLRALDKNFWQTLLQRSQCTSLSLLSNSHCDAYLLSESSLFVWEHRMTMITCGKTSLVEAALYFLKEIARENLEFLIYERKNEYFPFRQSSDFYQDIQKFKEEIDGEALLFGEKAGHHLLLFHSKKNFTPLKEDLTFEILMYDFIEEETKNIFESSSWEQEPVRRLIHLDSILPGFQKDEYFFHPQGYSLNALKDRHYYTVHVTKEGCHCLYLSFETNLNLMETEKKKNSRLFSLISFLKPRAFDVIVVKSLSSDEKLDPSFLEKNSLLSFCEDVEDYLGTSFCSHVINRGYKTEFCHFVQKMRTSTQAKKIPF